MTRLDLLRIQYSELIAPGAELRIPDGWLDAFERWLDELEQVRRAAGPGTRLRINECVLKHDGLERRVGMPWFPPHGLHGRVAEADRRLDAALARTCHECGSPGALRLVGGVLLVACDDHSQGHPVIERNGDGT
mgnify:FL=1